MTKNENVTNDLKKQAVTHAPSQTCEVAEETLVAVQADGDNVNVTVDEDFLATPDDPEVDAEGEDPKETVKAGDKRISRAEYDQFVKQNDPAHAPTFSEVQKLQEKLDSREKYINHKEIRAPKHLEEAIKAAKKHWVDEIEQRVGIRPNENDAPFQNRGETVSLDAPVAEEDGHVTRGEASDIALEISLNPFEPEPQTAHEYMAMIVKTEKFTIREKMVFEMITEGTKQKDMAIKLGVCDGTISLTVRSIEEKLADDTELRRYFRIIS